MKMKKRLKYFPLLLIFVFVNCGDSSPNDCEFIGKWCSDSVQQGSCDGISEIEFFESGEFVIKTIGTTTGVETRWESEDCNIVSVKGDDGQGGNPQVFRIEILNITANEMDITGLGIARYIRTE